MLSTIEHGDRVTIVNRFGQERSGKAVMRGPVGWVLDMGGKHGQPAVATETNIVRVRKSRRNDLRQLREDEASERRGLAMMEGRLEDL